MLKNILNLKGVKTLSKEEQRNIKGGGRCCNPALDCCSFCGACGAGFNGSCVYCLNTTCCV